MERPIRKIVSIEKTEVQFANKHMKYQEGLTTWGPVVMEAIEERHCFYHSDGETCFWKLFVFFRWIFKFENFRYMS